MHELGHYLVGRWFGVKAEAFSIGFGKELFGWTDKRGTRWKLSALPLGGYVQFAGDMNPASQPDAEWLTLPAAERDAVFPGQAAVAARADRAGWPGDQLHLRHRDPRRIPDGLRPARRRADHRDHRAGLGGGKGRAENRRPDHFDRRDLGRRVQRCQPPDRAASARDDGSRTGPRRSAAQLAVSSPRRSSSATGSATSSPAATSASARPIRRFAASIPSRRSASRWSRRAT